MSISGDTPPPRPRVAITPMRPQRSTERVGAVRWAVLGWIVTIALTVVTVVVVVASLDDIRAVLAADLIREHPESGTDAGRAVDVSLLVGACVALVVVVLGRRVRRCCGPGVGRGGRCWWPARWSRPPARWASTSPSDRRRQGLPTPDCPRRCSGCRRPRR
ncbi:hypothetical protein [Gordonia westfalica]|uniref:hypothetical protein n=1 Tax=Gordonia westfalica TaxID=158898 RepID=UPI001FCB0058|nr:hypothetical protein [Gordonia westfalica]